MTSVTKPDSIKFPLGRSSINGVSANSRTRAIKSFTVETRHISGFDSRTSLFLCSPLFVISTLP